MDGKQHGAVQTRVEYGQDSQLTWPYWQSGVQESVMQMNILEAKNRLSQLIRSVQAGEEVVIANRGKPVARLVPVSGRGRKGSPAKGGARTILDWLDNHPLPDYARRSAKDIDADIQEERESWD